MNNSSTTTLENGLAWLNHLRGLGRSPKTVAAYASALINLDRFLRRRGITRARHIRRQDLTQWQRSLRDAGNTLATQNAFTRIVDYWFQWQCDEGLIFNNPAVVLQIVRLPLTLPRCLTHAEITAVLDRTGGADPVLQRDRALLELAYATGARLAEIAGLEVTSVDLTHCLVRLLGKGGHERVVPLTKHAVRAMARYLKSARESLLDGSADHGALFIGVRGGRRLDAPGVAGVFERARKRAGLATLTAHDFRRTFATQLIAHGAHPAAVASMLGHRGGYRHLARYVHPNLSAGRGRRALR